MKLPIIVEYILNKLFENGYRADVVGGPVRDYLRGKEPSDYDIATSAEPCEVKRIFSGHRTVDTGIKHGTVSLIIDREQYEITTYRKDGEYKDSRHPETVEFTDDITADLARRDFTVNSMAYNPRDGITDPYGGRADLEIGVIRAVGDPECRFREDALRILRAVRFASVLGFSIDSATASAMRRCAHLLKNVSAERIYTEWYKLLSGDHRLDIIAEYNDVLSVVIPEIQGAVLPDINLSRRASPFILQLAIFALTANDPSIAYENAMKRLKTDRKTRDLGAKVLLALSDDPPNDDSSLGKQLFRLGEECARNLTELNILLGRAEKSSFDRFDKYVKDGKPYRISDLAIGGRELVDAGILGVATGACLSELLTLVIEGKLDNCRASLLAYISQRSRADTEK